MPTVAGGLAVAQPGFLAADPAEELFHGTTAVLMTVLVVTTGALVLRLYQRRGRQLWKPVVVPHPPIDTVWDRALVRPARWLAVLVLAHDRDVIEAYADGAAGSTRGIGWLLRLTQNGSVQGYLMVVVVGAAAIAVAAGVLA